MIPSEPQRQPDKIWSEKQNDIFVWFSKIDGTIEHLVVRARAGTGKTTTICKAIEFIPKGFSVLVAAFGKDIQVELEKRLRGTSAVVKTIHSLGLSCVRRFWPDVAVNYGSDRERDLAERVCGGAAPDAIKKLVAKLCTKGRLCVPHATCGMDLQDVAFSFECDPDEEWDADGFDLDYVCARAYEAMVLAAAEKPIKTGIDGADMLYLPVRNRWMRKTYDVGVIDEAQDMNNCQLELVMGMVKGRLVVVGDDRQAIFGFAGADSGSLDRLKTALNAKELPLNTTYRCGTIIVAKARRLVPDFEAGPNNPVGEISYLGMDKLTKEASAGDFILSRVNAPLVSIAMSLLRSGKRTKIAGRDIGKGLVTLIRKFRARSVPDFLRKIESWKAKELQRLESKYAGKTDTDAFQARVDGINDQATMLTELSDGAKNVQEIEDRITSLFTDDGLGDKGLIVCSSIHKAKGKEADKVFVLSETLRDWNIEELNLQYVAITRAKNHLVYVGKETREDSNLSRV